MLDFSKIEKRIKELEESKHSIKEILNKLGIKLNEVQKPIINQFKLDVNCLTEVRVACIMDRFTLDSYKPECKLLELTPNNWENEINDFKPHLVFIESAWQGKDGSWNRKIANGSNEYFNLASYCQDEEIPLIFWNKEDPVYTDTFMPIARMADAVFTTDIDCIKKYKQVLNHDRVYHLHFAAQPKIHNPIEKYKRKDKFCFAGAYYHNYPKRAEVFDKFTQIFIDKNGFDIYDRNYKNALPEHAFPKTYDPYILGKLDSSEIDVAYKGYNYGINMNSVSQSQTMFARRVFEMLASNTVTVGNYSRGVKNLFGDLTICTDDDKEMEKKLQLFCEDKVNYRKYRLAGLRRVLQEHLYEDRLDYIINKVFNCSLKKVLPTAIVVTDADDKQLKRIIRLFEKQSYNNKKLLIISETSKESGNIKYITKSEAEKLKIKSFESNAVIVYFHPEDYYGPNYLTDIILTMRYNECNGIGKNRYFTNRANSISVTPDSKVYEEVECLNVRRSAFKVSSEFWKDKNIVDFVTTKEVELSYLFAIDEFNYCEECQLENCELVDDLFIADQGISIKNIEKAAENILISRNMEEGFAISFSDIYNIIKNKNTPKITISLESEYVVLTSKLGADENEYIYFEKVYEVNEVTNKEKLSILFSGVGGVEALGVIVFYDKEKKKISPAFAKSATLFTCDIPNNACFIKMGIRIRGKGVYKLKQIRIGLNADEVGAGVFLSRSNVLVLSNQYPSYDNLYRNMFVHKRLEEYKKDGLVYDTMRMNIYAKDSYDEFEGINIVEGQSEKLVSILENSGIDTVCVHFLDKQMWDILKNFNKLRVLVWVHGSEIQPWWRREYNYSTESDLNKAKKDSEVRMQFWKSVFEAVPEHDIHFIFVSQYFADEIFEDNKVLLPQEKYSIIHNCIDTDLFSYIAKDVEQRKKLLSIRPYASRKYANDLTVKAILELVQKPFFKDLEILLIGTGELFDDTIKPLKKYKNVKILKQFLRQDEMAGYHKEYGIFLTPTRMDAQGVSRDEAMASGLVPITNAVAAIPEFVDAQCGILAESEDYKAMAEGIEQLYNDEKLFTSMSENARKRVWKQSSREKTIVKEESLIRKK